MKISSLNLNYSQTSFSSRKDVMKKSDSFTDIIVKEARHKNLDKHKLENIIQSFVPGVKLRLRKFSNENINGTFSPSYIYDTDAKKFEFDDRTLIITPPNKKGTSVADYVRTLAHEMTHVLQSADKEIGDLPFLEKNLPTKDNQTANKALIAGSNTWEYFEYRLLYDILNGFEKLTYLNNGKSPFKITIDKKTLNDCLAEIYEESKKAFPEISIDFIKKFIKLQLLHEADAYEAGAKAYRKFKRQPLEEGDLFTTKLYKRINEYI